MTILMIVILSIDSEEESLSEAASWLDWFRELSDGESFALFVACVLAAAFLLSWLIRYRVKNLFEKWKQYERDIQQRKLIEQGRLLEERERERAAFFNEPWGRKKAALALKEYRRELERRGNPYAKCYMPNLSVEDLHQRIDFLETLEFDAKKKQPSLSLADRRIACRKLHDEERQKELQELSNAFFDNEAARTQEVMDTYNFWNNKKRNALQNIGRAERNDNVTA